MSRKIIFSESDIKEIIRLYSQENFSFRTIGKQFHSSNTVISKVLIENEINIRPSRSISMGGKAAAKKRCRNKKKDAYNESQRSWRLRNNDYFLAYRKEYRTKNKERLSKEYKKNYEKRKQDVMFRLQHSLRGCISSSLKNQGGKKKQSTFNLLRCTPEELRRHLESKFTLGMTWDNYGEWHIDHIKPISSFTFTRETDPEFLECWALSNLQPLWATTREIEGVVHLGNLNKGAKY